MAWFEAAAAVAATLGSAVIKSQSGNDAPEESTPGFNTSGNAQSMGVNNDVRSAPPSTYSGGALSRTNQFLGTPVGGIAKDVAGGFLGDYRQRRNSRNRFKDLRSEGLTAQEIAGSSGGGAVQSQGNTLGSGPMLQAQGQREFVAGENAKQRAHELEKIEASKEVPRRQVSLAERLNPLQLQILEQNKVLIGTQINKNINDLTYFWQRIFSVMSRENVMASVAAFVSGISIKGVLTGMGSDEERQAAGELFDALTASNSHYLVEALGVQGWLARLFTNESIIGNKSNPSKVNTTGKFLNKFNPFNLKVKGRE